MATSAKPVAPRFLCVFVHCFYGFVVTSNSKVLVVAAQFGTERLVLIPYGIMTVFLTPVPRHFQVTAEALARCLLFDYRIAFEGYAPVERKSEKVECSALLPAFGLYWRSSKPYQCRFVGVQFQSEAAKPFWQDCFYPVGVCFQLKAYYEVVGPADDEAFAFHPGFYFFGKPVIKDIVEEDVAEQGS